MRGQTGLRGSEKGLDFMQEVPGGPEASWGSESGQSAHPQGPPSSSAQNRRGQHGGFCRHWAGERAAGVTPSSLARPHTQAGSPGWGVWGRGGTARPFGDRSGLKPLWDKGKEAAGSTCLAQGRSPRVYEPQTGRRGTKDTA